MILNRLMVLLFCLLILRNTSFAAWPNDNEWIDITKNGALLQDPLDDAQGSVNVVFDADHAAAKIFNDGSFLYFRLRLDKDPSPNGQNSGELSAFAWGVLLETDGILNTYEYMVMIDGLVNPEVIRLRQNSIQQSLDDPSDKTEDPTLGTPESLDDGVNFGYCWEQL